MDDSRQRKGFQLFRINPFGRVYSQPTQTGAQAVCFQLFRINPFGRVSCRNIHIAANPASISFQLFRINPFGRDDRLVERQPKTARAVSNYSELTHSVGYPTLSELAERYRYCFQLFRINPFGREAGNCLFTETYQVVSNYSELTHSVGVTPLSDRTVPPKDGFQLFRINPFGRDRTLDLHHVALL